MLHPAQNPPNRIKIPDCFKFAPAAETEGRGLTRCFNVPFERPGRNKLGLNLRRLRGMVVLKGEAPAVFTSKCPINNLFYLIISIGNDFLMQPPPEAAR